MLYHSKHLRMKKSNKKKRERYDVIGPLTPREKVRLLTYGDNKWRDILSACIIMNEEHKGRFAGAWVMQLLRADGITPPSNLRTLSKFGLLKLDSTTRSGNRAYYTMPDAKLIASALKKT